MEAPRSFFPIGSSRVSDLDVNLSVESEVDCEKSDWRNNCTTKAVNSRKLKG